MAEPDQTIQSFTCGTVSEAPEAVGLYAWYARLDVGEADWRFDPIDGKDAGTGRFLDLLARHSLRFQPQPVSLTGTGPFATVLRGELEDKTQEVLQEALARREAPEGEPPPEGQPPSKTYDQKRAAKVHEAVVSAEHRKAVAAILSAAAPIVSSPLYIGVAKSLRDRLTKHKTQIFKAATFVRNNPGGRDELLKGDTPSFGSRAISAGFSPDNLVVWTLNLDKVLVDVSDREKQRVIAEAAEWFLNRWHRPIFGRR